MAKIVIDPGHGGSNRGAYGNDAHDNFDTYHRHLGAFIAHKKPLLAIHYRLKELDKMLKP